MNWILQFLHWLGSFFDTEASTSSRRLQAYVVLAVLTLGNVHFYLWCTIPWLHIYTIVIDMVFILLMYGLVTFQELAQLKTGFKVTESQTNTDSLKQTITEKTITEPVTPEPTNP